MNVDVAALRMAAQRMESAAEILSGALGPGSRGLEFGAALAGRSHGQAGAALREAIDRIVAAALASAAGSRDIADALRCCADRYRHTDSTAAGKLR